MTSSVTSFCAIWAFFQRPKSPTLLAHLAKHPKYRPKRSLYLAKHARALNWAILGAFSVKRSGHPGDITLYESYDHIGHKIQTLSILCTFSKTKVSTGGNWIEISLYIVPAITLKGLWEGKWGYFSEQFSFGHQTSYFKSKTSLTNNTMSHYCESCRSWPRGWLVVVWLHYYKY